MADDADFERAARAYASASASAQKAALSSSNGFIKFLEKLGLRALANILADFIREVGWPFLKKIIKALLGLDDDDE